MIPNPVQQKEGEYKVENALYILRELKHQTLNKSKVEISTNDLFEAIVQKNNGRIPFTIEDLQNYMEAIYDHSLVEKLSYEEGNSWALSYLTIEKYQTKEILSSTLSFG